MGNLPGGMFRQSDDGAWTFALPIETTASIPLIDIEQDTGKFVKSILLKADESLGKEYYGAEAYYSPQRIVDEFKAVYPNAGKSAKFVSLPDATFKAGMGGMGMPEKAQVELLQNMQLLGKEFGYYSGADLKGSRTVSERDTALVLIEEQILDDPLTTWTEFIMTAPAFKGLD